MNLCFLRYTRERSAENVGMDCSTAEKAEEEQRGVVEGENGEGELAHRAGPLTV